MSKNVIILSDGTGNEPKVAGYTNVLRLYDMLVQDERQLVWYDPGVGTQGSPKALTALGRSATKLAGLAFGYGLKDNVVDAYTYLMHNFEAGDRIFLFGFSRGAYTARAIAGLLYQVGLLRRGQENLIPYALKLFWWKEGKEVSDQTWREVERISKQFARPDFPRRKPRLAHYVGVWDTVKAAGVLRGRLVLPWTAEMPIARRLSHAVSIDERRRPYKPNLLSYDAPGRQSGDFKEVWFAGVHSDVGGTFEPDHRLADISLEWLVSEAIDNGLLVDEQVFAKYRDQPASNAEGEIHDMGWGWWITTIGFRRKIVPDGARIHESVKVRMERSGSTGRPYRPKLPTDFSWEPWHYRPEAQGDIDE